MKRLTVLTISLSALAIWAVFYALLAPKSSPQTGSEAEKAAALPKVYDATGAMLAAINAQGVEKTVAHPAVYDATGAMLAAVNAGNETKVNTAHPIAYDATGAMLAAINAKGSGTTTSYPLVYDATGAMLKAINP